MLYAWGKGYTGQGVFIKDVECCYNQNHIEFKGKKNIKYGDGLTIPVPPFDSFKQHGTATFGIVAADKGNFGTTGMAFGVKELAMHPVLVEGAYLKAYMHGISSAIKASKPGNIIMYELQALGADNKSYVPIEYHLAVWKLTKAATDAGFIILAAAGNGSINLDSKEYDEYNKRGDSGAIIVGAGTSDKKHAPLNYTTYGKRVNLQGWGENVLTTDLKDTDYYIFSGTSAATPIVASCAAVLQSISLNVKKKLLKPAEIRDLLVSTGTPQSGTKLIGPLPNMKKAINKLLGTNRLRARNFSNDVNIEAIPTKNAVSINVINPNFIGSSVTIINYLGQKVYFNDNLSDNNTSINTANLKKRMYIISIRKGDEVLVKKFIKE